MSEQPIQLKRLHPFLAGPPETTVEVIEVNQGEK